MTKCIGNYTFEHEWRMFTREQIWTTDDIRDNMGVVIGGHSTPTGEYKELWYCVKCRHEEKRIVPDARVQS